jgi:hypothetical protein
MMNRASSVQLQAPDFSKKPGVYYAFARNIALFGSIVSAVVGVCALFGWLLDGKWINVVIEQVAPNEALGFFLAGTALFLLNGSSASNLRLLIAMSCALVLAAIAGRTMSEYFLHADFGFDRFLIPIGTHQLALEHGRMSFQSSISFMVLSGGILCLNFSSPRVLKIQQIGALIVVVSAAAAILGHLYGFPFLTKIPYCSELSLISAYTLICAGTPLCL